MLETAINTVVSLAVEYWSNLVLLAFASAVVLVVLPRARKYSHIRTQELEAANTALQHHFVAAQRVVVDAATPDAVADAVQRLSAVMGNRDLARRLAVAIDGNPHAVSAKGLERSARLTEALLQLEKHRPDIVADFNLAFDQAFHAMGLRFPEVRQPFNRFLASQTAPVERSRPVLAKEAFSAIEACEPQALAA